MAKERFSPSLLAALIAAFSLLAVLIFFILIT